MTLEELRSAANELPFKPGVYLMMDKTNEVIYVGKAKLLKNRVGSYFRGFHENPKTHTLVSRIDHFDIIICKSEFDALVTESALIKQHKPRYNILLKDDKGYPFAAVDLLAEYPQFEVVNKPAGDNRRYLGPYISRTTLYEALKAVKQTLRLPGCSKRFPRDLQRGRPCLNKQLGLCEGWCTGTPDVDAYKQRINDAIAILEGRSSEVSDTLEAAMFKAADALQFELASKLRDRLKALNSLGKKGLPAPGAAIDTDAIGFYRGEAKSAFVVMCYGNGVLAGKEYEVLDAPLEDDGEAVSEILRQYYAQRGTCPRTVLLPVELPDAEELERLFRETFHHPVELLYPRRGDKYSLVKLAKDNAFEEVVRATTKQERENKTLDWLKEHLQLVEAPVRIEAFDISHTGGEDVVGSMVVFKDAKPLKRAYRRFKIKTVVGNDDYHSMREVLERRLKHHLDGDEKFGALPNLILLDGGATLAAMGKALMDELGLNVPVYGMVKDDRHRTRALVDYEDNEIAISARPDIFSFVGRIQEETHRFAIDYHRNLREKSSTKSALDDISGVGDARKDALFKRFKNITAIKNATFDELCEVVPKNVAEKILAAFAVGSSVSSKGSGKVDIEFD